MELFLIVLLFFALFGLLLMGYPVAFTLGGVALVFGLLYDPTLFGDLPGNIFGRVMTNEILIAVPLFIYMGMMLEKSKLAEELLETMGFLFGKLRGGLAISVVIVGALLAASTGIVGATVVTMGLLSLPTMLKRGYRAELATGTICASGTLGQIIPPSIVLVLLGSVMQTGASTQVDVGSLFLGAVIPGVLLVVLYVGWIGFLAAVRPAAAPAMPEDELREFRKHMVWRVLFAFLPPLLLILLVLGSIFAGIATPTEAAAVGALGATGLALARGKFNRGMLQGVMAETTKISCMVFLILIGARAFSLVFITMGGDDQLAALIQDADLGPRGFLLLVMVVIFLAGFFIDFIEITFIIVPIVVAVIANTGMQINLLWLGILIALNLQTSFLTPPFGFSLFYLKGVAPPEVTTGHIYRGIVPFIVIQLICIALVILVPDSALWLPRAAGSTPSP